MLATEAAILIELQLVWRISLVFRCCIVALLTFRAGKRDNIPHDEILTPLFVFEDMRDCCKLFSC
jgi:hypothetical protein